MNANSSLALLVGPKSMSMLEGNIIHTWRLSSSWNNHCMVYKEWQWKD